MEKTEGDAVNSINPNESDRTSRSRSISHAIVVIMASKTNLPENVAIVVDMLLTKTRVQREEKPAMIVEKLVILLMFADQDLELWPP